MSNTLLKTGLAAMFALLAGGCIATPDTTPASLVNESWITPAEEPANIDSVASYRGPNGENWLLATAKGTHVVRLFDGASGEWLQDIGKRGDGPGEFLRPNGIWIESDLLFVVERDNRRVQVLRLPDFAPLATFGQERLQKPYGLYVQPLKQNEYAVYVTDNYELPGERIPPAKDLDRRVQQWQVSMAADGIEIRHLRVIGETSGSGVLRVVESLHGDPANNRLLIAEEDESRHTDARTVKVYNLDGRYTGPLMGQGRFRGQVEGIALRACADGSGQWLIANQSKSRNLFNAFDRQTLAYLGSFEGPATLNTDGIWFSNEGSQTFPGGVFYAVHDDQAVAAFDWNRIAVALGLATGTC